MCDETLLELEAGKLYILSGLPGCGKSSAIQRSGLEEFTLSSDGLRQQILGNRLAPVAGPVGYRRIPLAHQDGAVFQVLEAMVEARMREGLTTFVDSTAISDEERSRWAALAHKHGMKPCVLIFDRTLDQVRSRNAQRIQSVPEVVLQKFQERFQADSRFPWKPVPDQSLFRLVPRTLPSAAIDVIGDVHGLLPELLRLLDRLGYRMASGVPGHPDGRRLLFLGDIVDRGPDSIEVLRLVANACAAGHYAILGNHENKLLRFWDEKAKGEAHAGSFSSAETAVAFMRLPPEEQTRLIGFLRESPASFVWESGTERWAFCHADVEWFDPLRTPRSDLLYGTKKNKDFPESPAVAPSLTVDQRYHAGWETPLAVLGGGGVNAYRLIRGHVPQRVPVESVFSLEERQAFGGHLVALPFDRFIRKGADRAAFDHCVVRQACAFDFDRHQAQQRRLHRGLMALKDRGLVQRQRQPQTGLTLYKYSRKVFYDALWAADPLLLKARGLVLDLAGNIVQHPFDKVFNYRENGTGLDITEDRPVLAVTKLNGFLACVTADPYQANQLLVTTTGSFDSPFVAMARAMLERGEISKIYRTLRDQDVTLLFEVLHPEDPHIIPYSEKEFGAWLIGARGKRQEDRCWAETALDDLAGRQGFRRPAWETTTFGILRAKAREARIEGWMVRSADAAEDFLLKLKTPYYLTTKFLGRMGDKHIAHLFGNPRNFKEKVDEEFYELVDRLSMTMDQVAFRALSTEQRIELIRSLVA
ncbi:AAA family ATPase [Thiomonas sp.]